MKAQKQKKTHDRPELKKPNTTSFSINKRISWTFALTIALITFLIYLPALKNGFVTWDDNEYVYENPNIQSLDFRFLKWFFTAVVAFLWHPLTMASYAFDYAIWGLAPLGYHLTNNLLHAFNTFLILILTVKLVELYNSNDVLSKKALIAGAVTALLFGIHPLHVESVAWVSERKDVLSAFFYLLSLLAYLSYASSINSKKRFYYAACLAFFILALLSKPMAVTLPIVLLILDFYPLGRLAIINIKGLLVEKLPFVILSLTTSLLTIWAHHSKGGLPSSEIFPILDRIFIAVRAYAFYLFKMILPLNLAPLYPYPEEINFFGIEYLGSLILLVTITYLCIWSSRKNKLFSAVWLYYIFTLMPAIGIVKVGSQAAADRYTYLPSVGPFFLIGLGAANIFGKNKKSRIAIIVTSILMVGVLTNRTVKQIAIWHDSITLWSHEIEIYPQNVYTAYNNRGLAYDKSGDYQTAIKDYNKAIEINPQSQHAYNNRGFVYDKLGEYKQAMKNYNKAIELDPLYAEAYNNRGGLYFGTGDYQHAIDDYNKAIELDPQYNKAYYSRGTLYNSISYYQEAIKDFTKSIELNPNDPQFYNNRGSAYNSLGKYQEAINDYNSAIRLNPNDAYAYYNLGVAYSSSGNIDQSIINYKKASSLGLKEAQEYLKQQGVD